jgi:hypothetical protein
MKRIAVVLIVLATLSLGRPGVYAQVSVSVAIAPPEIPVYVQPDDPYDGYLWTPGYWAYDPTDGYYWVPGVWLAPPSVGFLWTPGYWGFYGGYYHWHRGYWGPHIGYYGGINYGCGYWGHGYDGGRWEGGHFRYNTAVSHVDSRVVHNTYVDRSAVHTGGSRAAFNGPRGISARPTASERIASRDKHVSATSVQRSHIAAARKDPATHFATNKGNPGTRAAMSRPATVSHTSTATHTNTARSAPHQNTARSAPHQSTARSQQNHTSAQHQNVSRPQHQASQQHSMQQHQAPQQHSMQQQHQAPRMQQHNAAPQQRSQNMGRMQAPRAAPQRSPMPMGGHEGGGGEKRR